MHMERLSVVGYKEQQSYKAVDSDDIEDDNNKVEEEEEEKCEIKDQFNDRDIKLQETGQKFLILKRKKNQDEKYARQEVIYTKSPVDIKVSVKSKYDEIKCICELKYEAYEKLSKLTKLYRHWKDRYKKMDLIESRYLSKIF